MFKLIKNILFNLPFVLWLMADLRFLRPFRRKIRAYRLSGEAEKEQKEILLAENVWGGRICRKLRLDLTVEGESRLPDGPVVFVSNHESYADIPLFFAAVTSKQFGFVAKENLTKLPLYGKWIRDVRSIFIRRGDARSSLRTLEEGVEMLQKGFSFAVFPEGTRGKGGPVQAFKKGSLRLATKPGVPVVPVTHRGAFRVFEETGVVRKGARVRFFIHEPIETAGMSRQDAAALPDAVQHIICAKLNEWEGASLHEKF
ncbi:MAG: 1-acyl-sn-glycerol-3-phosphate acyltransferase [Clostridiales Family XIII bacterium]|jgi:1-acyl-sn-glycerol-3-phosphate acyltransferase|nr:1-acyl-sn-glycerol-3-phosphate acyltransferase [Clostridiales Family XIII bacterium]